MPEATQKPVERLNGRGYAAQEHHAQAARPLILHARRPIHARSLRGDPRDPPNRYTVRRRSVACERAGW